MKEFGGKILLFFSSARVVLSVISFCFLLWRRESVDVFRRLTLDFHFLWHRYQMSPELIRFYPTSCVFPNFPIGSWCVSQSHVNQVLLGQVATQIPTHTKLLG